MSDALLSVEEAFRRVMDLFAPLGAEDAPLAEAAGRVLAEDVVARRDQPPFAASAMDGYALRSADCVAGARLAVVGLSLAGTRFQGTIGPGEAARIFTGAPMPEGADRVLIQEDADSDGDWVIVREGLDSGPHVRPAGGDFTAGARLAAPRRLGPPEMALAAAMGAGTVRLARRPIIALIPTGDELVMPGEDPGPDQIICSNNFGLKAMLEAAGAEARLLPIARDSAESLVATLDLARGADLIVTLGGASVGDFDLVKKTALGMGFDPEFHRIALRPGKPLMAGRLNGVPMIGLPGNPVSAMVCGLLFLVPAVARMLGLTPALPPRFRARLAADLGPNGPRTHYMRARVTAGPDGWDCLPFSRQDSSLLSELAEANALLVRDPGDPRRKTGEVVEFCWLSSATG